ncbi:MAG: metalloregulator ArsR/SmtB family transcription factor [Pseudomonadales bacterium]|nr:metalloregulator ArsR/SmtB family transcription factor [Pseudomonadales bacterium]
MTLDPLSFFKCLSDETRLSVVLLIAVERELCVCELTEALQISQPKVSRHLAQLRECGLLCDRREGQWVFYRFSPGLPDWACQVIQATTENNHNLIAPALKKLLEMGNRPQRKQQCCQS